MDIDYNPYSKAFWEDPWSVYRDLRDHDPVHCMEAFGGAWALSRFEDLWNAHLDSENYTTTLGTSPPPLLLGQDSGPGGISMPSLDGRDHRDYRKTISGRYTQASVAKLETNMRKLTREELEPALKSGRLDIHELARNVALYTIADMIGLERDLAVEARHLIDVFYEREPDIVGTTPRGEEAFGQCMKLLMGMTGRWRKDPPPASSHINSWVNEKVRDDTWMTDEQIMGNTSMLIITGSDTVPFNIANLFFYLNQHPDQLEMLKNDLSLVPNAFEECVRFDHPTNILGRRLVNDVELHGKTMKKGDAVVFLYQSAGRDEREFENPDRFDISRPRAPRSMNFGHGLHSCLGHHLAKLEGRVIIEEILSAIPDYVVREDQAERYFGEFLQGYRHMPIEFEPS